MLWPRCAPSTLTISGDVTKLNMQTQCLGVYHRIEGREAAGRPIWKHATADLCIAAQTVDDEPGWVVSRWTTFGVKEQRCMQGAGEARVMRNGVHLMVPIADGNKEEPQALPNLLLSCSRSSLGR